MQFLVRIVPVYFLAASALVALVRENPLVLLAEIVGSVPSSLGLFVETAWWALPAVAVAAVALPRAEAKRRLSQGLVAVFATTAFFLTFTMVKASLTHVVPFWADPALAEIDRALHFGHDPWELAHRLAPWVKVDHASKVYFSCWLAPAMFLPVFLILFDGDGLRVRRYILLYGFVWIVLGNLLAMAFMSAGPVFYDRLLDTDRFAGLDLALDGFRASGAQVGFLQERLWTSYVTGTGEAGSGISAFPSVHVAMVTVIAFYLGERWPGLVPLGVALVGAYLFLSVFLGWHYAIDGYASIALIAAAWALLRRRGAARGLVPVAAE